MLAKRTAGSCLGLGSATSASLVALSPASPRCPSLVSPPAVSLPRLKRYLSSGGARRCDAYVWTVPPCCRRAASGLAVSSPFPHAARRAGQQCLPRRPRGTIEWRGNVATPAGLIHRRRFTDLSVAHGKRLHLGLDYTLSKGHSYSGVFMQDRVIMKKKSLPSRQQHRCRLSLRGVASKRSSRLRL